MLTDFEILTGTKDQIDRYTKEFHKRNPEFFEFYEKAIAFMLDVYSPSFAHLPPDEVVYMIRRIYLMTSVNVLEAIKSFEDRMIKGDSRIKNPRGILNESK